MTDIENHIQYLHVAELQFRLASAVRLATTFEMQPLDLPIEWSHGKDSVRLSEITLSADDADCASWGLHRLATFLMAIAMKDSIRAAVPDPKATADVDIRSAYQISRLILNAFAHTPFDPVWSIDPDCRDRIFTVRDVVALDTTDLHDRHFDWHHYGGGPFALLRRRMLFIQQGDLVRKSKDY